MVERVVERGERGTRWILLVLLLGQLILLTAQIPDSSETDASLLEGLAVRAVAPFSRLIAGSVDLTDELGDRLVFRRQLEAENRALRAEVEDLRRKVLENRGIGQELERLARAVDYAQEAPRPLRVADIVYADHSSWLQALILYVGGGGAEVNQPVVAPDGLVGRVVLVAGGYAKVQLISDRAASVGAMVVRTRRQGVVHGLGSGSLELQFVPLQADVRPGDEVVTAGIDGVYPRGVPIGRVVSVEPGDEIFHRIRLVPAVELGHIDQVYILERETLAEEIKEAAPSARP